MCGVAQAARGSGSGCATGRKMTLGGGKRASMPGNQFAVADAAMYVESARALLYQEARAVTTKAASEVPFTPDDPVRLSTAGLVASHKSQPPVDGLLPVFGIHGPFLQPYL